MAARRRKANDAVYNDRNLDHETYGQIAEIMHLFQMFEIGRRGWAGRSQAARCWLFCGLGIVAAVALGRAGTAAGPAATGFDPEPLVALFELVVDNSSNDPDSARQCLSVLAEKTQSGELSGEQLAALRPRLQPLLNKLLAAESHPLYLDAALLAANWKDPSGIKAARSVFSSPKPADEKRLQALAALIAAGDEGVPQSVQAVLVEQGSGQASFRAAVLAALGRIDSPAVAEVVLGAYSRLEPGLQPVAIELLTQRPAWAKSLLGAIGRNRLPASVLNANQVGKLLASRDAELAALVQKHWGAIRSERNPKRELAIAQWRAFLRRTPGNAERGQVVFKNLCGQCHKIYGEGQEVGPDLTGSGRSTFDQLLSNVFDPSLVIGSVYQARTVIANGRVITGLLVEDNEQRVIVKTQGGKLETIARDDIDEILVSKLSMMPEELEKQLQPHELADLFAFLTLDKPPSDPTAKRLPGVDGPPPTRETTDASQFPALVAEVAPGFTCGASGVLGMALLENHAGRKNVLRTHPVDPQTPCSLRGQVEAPQGKKTGLVIQATHDSRGDWKLIVKGNGRVLREELVGPKSAPDGWLEVAVDLTEFAGQSVELEIQNAANDWNFEFGYWGKIEVRTE